MKGVVSVIILLLSVLSSQAQVPNGMEYSVLPTPAEMKFGKELYLVPDNLGITGLREDGVILIPNEAQLSLFQSILQRNLSDSAGYNISFFLKPYLDEKQRSKEFYKLSVNEAGIQIYIVAEAGLIPALQTLHQLFIYKDGKTYLPYCEITDYPDSPWRGLLLDVCRHFIPLKVLYRTVDAMSACKMNILHLHLSDDQAFRIECKTFPLLHQKGSNGQYYTQEEIKALIKYASDRGVQIVPEFDIPGHTTAWLTAYPEFASLTIPQKPETGYGIFKPVMNPANEKLYKHLDLFFKEMSALFPSEYMHIGGDEVRSDDWLNNPKIKKFMTKKGYTTVPQLQNYFNGRVEKILSKYNKKIIGWDEILEGKPSKGTIIHAWRGEKYQREAIAHGYGVIRSYGFYIDQTYTAGEYYARFDTLNSSLYLGGEAAMWAELVDSVTLESRLWPNAAAIAEMYWRHPKQIDSISFYKKLYAFSSMLGRMGCTNESYVYDVLKRRGDTEDSTLVKLCSYISPIDGYRRHKMIKADTAYNTSYSLNTYADLGRPTSLSYMEFMLMLEEYKRNPNTQKREALMEWLMENIKAYDTLLAQILSEIVIDQTDNDDDNMELRKILIAMISADMAALEWLHGRPKEAKERLEEAKQDFKGRTYELSILNLLEQAMK